MNRRFLKTVTICCLLAASTGLSAIAQNRPGGGPGGPPPGGPGLGGPGGPGGPAGPGGPGPAGNPGGGGPNRTAHGANGVLQLGPVGRWWDDKTVIKAVGLSSTQKSRMDVIFSANKPAILASYKTYLSEQSKLQDLNSDPRVDQSRLFAAIDSVNQARAQLQKATSAMLLQIRAEMSADQIDKLEKLR